MSASLTMNPIDRITDSKGCDAAGPSRVTQHIITSQGAPPIGERRELSRSSRMLARDARFSLLIIIKSRATPPVGSYTPTTPWYE
jgi:hypothetical protein